MVRQKNVLHFFFNSRVVHNYPNRDKPPEIPEEQLFGSSGEERRFFREKSPFIFTFMRSCRHECVCLVLRVHLKSRGPLCVSRLFVFAKICISPGRATRKYRVSFPFEYKIQSGVKWVHAARTSEKAVCTKEEEKEETRQDERSPISIYVARFLVSLFASFTDWDVREHTLRLVFAHEYLKGNFMTAVFAFHLPAVQGAAGSCRPSSGAFTRCNP